MSEGLELLCDDCHGQYIPQLMARRLYDAGWTVNPDDVVVCDAGPDDFVFWDTWCYILDEATFTDENGYTWRLYQDNDLWAYCDDLMTDEEYYNFYGEKRERIYTYTINLDERGEFSASVYDENGKEVLSIDAAFFDDGWMQHKNDISGLLDYLNDTLCLNVSDIEID